MVFQEVCDLKLLPLFHDISCLCSPPPLSVLLLWYWVTVHGESEVVGPPTVPRTLLVNSFQAERKPAKGEVVSWSCTGIHTVESCQVIPPQSPLWKLPGGTQGILLEVRPGLAHAWAGSLAASRGLALMGAGTMPTPSGVKSPWSTQSILWPNGVGFVPAWGFLDS